MHKMTIYGCTSVCLTKFMSNLNFKTKIRTTFTFYVDKLLFNIIILEYAF